MAKQAANDELLGMFRERRAPTPPPAPEPQREAAVAAQEAPKAAEPGVGQGDDEKPRQEPVVVPKAAVARAPRERAPKPAPQPVAESEMVDRKLRLPKRTLDRLRAAAAYSTPHTSLGRLAADAIDAHIDQLEKRRGSKFPELEGELPPGRRVGT